MERVNKGKSICHLYGVTWNAHAHAPVDVVGAAVAAADGRVVVRRGRCGSRHAAPGRCGCRQGSCPRNTPGTQRLWGRERARKRAPPGRGEGRCRREGDGWGEGWKGGGRGRKVEGGRDGGRGGRRRRGKRASQNNCPQLHQRLYVSAVLGHGDRSGHCDGESKPRQC